MATLTNEEVAEQIDAEKSHRGMHFTVDNPDEPRFWLLTFYDAQMLEIGDRIVLTKMLWVVKNITKKTVRGGTHHSITIESERGAKFTFDPRRDHFTARPDDTSDLRNLTIYRPRVKFRGIPR